MWVMPSTESLIQWGDHAFSYAVCAFLLYKYGGAIDGVKEAVEKLTVAINTLSVKKE